MAGTMAALVYLWQTFPALHAYGPWAYGGIGALLVGVLGLSVAFEIVPARRRQRQAAQLEATYVSGKDVPPHSFRLGPYETADFANFTRYDGAHIAVNAWIDRATSPILYLTGLSGSGKSSILQAWILPERATRTPEDTALIVRAYGDPGRALAGALTRHGLIDPCGPDGALSRALLEWAAEKAAPGQLLIIFDQFEEVLIAQDEESRAPLLALLTDLTATPIDGLTVLLALRSDYEAPLIALINEAGLPAMRAGGSAEYQTWFEVPLFAHAHVKQFFADR